MPGAETTPVLVATSARGAAGPASGCCATAARIASACGCNTRFLPPLNGSAWMRLVVRNVRRRDPTLERPAEKVAEISGCVRSVSCAATMTRSLKSEEQVFSSFNLPRIFLLWFWVG